MDLAIYIFYLCCLLHTAYSIRTEAHPRGNVNRPYKFDEDGKEILPNLCLVTQKRFIAERECEALCSAAGWSGGKCKRDQCKCTPPWKEPKHATSKDYGVKKLIITVEPDNCQDDSKQQKPCTKQKNPKISDKKDENVVSRF